MFSSINVDSAVQRERGPSSAMRVCGARTKPGKSALTRLEAHGDVALESLARPRARHAEALTGAELTCPYARNPRIAAATSAG